MSDYSDSPPPAPPRQRRRRAHLVTPNSLLEDIRAVENLQREFLHLEQSMAARAERVNGIVEARYRESMAQTISGDTLPARSFMPHPGISAERLQEMQAQGLLPSDTSRLFGSKPKFNGPIVTLTSALPKTTYKDREDTKGTEKSLKYLEVQRSVLKYLEKSAADTLTPDQARHWTQAIDRTSNKEPKAEEALRLCYYMRSQGYDVYSTIDADKNELHLWLVNQLSHERTAQYDKLYWYQNYATNEDLFPTSNEATHMHRRNAMVGHPPCLYGGDTTDEGELQVARRAAATGPARPRGRPSVAARLAATEVRLQRLIEREDADPDVVAAAIEEHAALQAQLQPEAEPAE